jgi:hypothetical protein
MIHINLRNDQLQKSGLAALFIPKGGKNNKNEYIRGEKAVTSLLTLKVACFGFV